MVGGVCAHAPCPKESRAAMAMIMLFFMILSIIIF